MIGTKIAHYEITAKLGEGGMGVVYRATDTKLSRDVAIKLLPAALTDDPGRLERFRREAQLLAQLNHPSIAGIHGVEDSDGQYALVMELAEGQTLAERLNTGPIPFEEALPIAKQIAEALEAAHERGIIHRDLKPANIKVSEDGQIKVLDFGLAKAMESDPTSNVQTEHSPTLTMAATQAGVVLGTAAYMSPEQARGRAADKRADIWSFGVVLYEMLTGRQVFGGETVSDTLAGVLRAEIDFSKLPAETPPAIRRLLRRCLERDRKQRLQAIGDARIEIDEAIAGGAEVPTAGQPAAASPARQRLIIGAALVLLAGLAIGWGVESFVRSDAPPPDVVRFTVSPAEGERLRNVAISPGGNRMLYVSLDTDQVSHVFIREFDQLAAEPLPGSEGAVGAFFSPDGRWVGVGSLEGLKKIAVSGGTPITISDSPATVSGSWGGSGSIVFQTSGRGGLSLIPDSGGSPAEIVRGMGLREPHFLPGGQTILYCEGRADGAAAIVALTLETGEKRNLFEGANSLIGGANSPHYVSSGHLVFRRGDTIWAVLFDAKGIRVSGEAVPVQEGVRSFDVSWNGHLLYVPRGEGRGLELEWMEPGGAAAPAGSAERTFEYMSLSPDGRRVALYNKGREHDIWIHDLERGALSRFTFEPGEDETPVWSPDGQRIAWAGSREGEGRGVFVRAADGSGEVQRVWNGSDHVHVDSWSPDGKALLLDRMNADILLIRLDGDGEAVPFLASKFREGFSQFSPDGRWIAYVSDESGRGEVYVCPYADPGGKWQVSTGGGANPHWSASGRELFYRGTGGSLMAVSVEAGDTFRADTPRLLVEADFADYGVAPDGRFLLLKPFDGPLNEGHIVLNWAEELKRLVPAGGGE